MSSRNDSLTDDGSDAQYLIEGYLQNNVQWTQTLGSEEGGQMREKSDSKFESAVFGEFARFIAEQLI
jgi:hypothetical protein